MEFLRTTIGQVCVVGDGAHASIARVRIGVSYLTSKNFNGNGIYLEQVDKISESDYYKHFREDSKAVTKPKEGDLIFSIIGSIGGAHLYTSNDKFGLSSSVAIIRPDSDKISPLFLLYYLKSPYLQKWVLAIKSGSAQGFLSLDMIKSLPVILPEKPLQDKIASILSAYDELIENNNQRIKLLEAMAEEIYKDWFVRLRFAGYESTKLFDADGKEVQHGTVGALPDGWEKGTLGDLVLFKKGRNITQDTVKEGNIPVVAGGLTPAYFHNTSNTSSPTITISASGANAGYVNIYYENVWASDCSFIDTKATPFIFFFYILLKNRQVEVFFLQKGSAQPHVYPKDIMSLKMAKPLLKLIERFEDLVTPFFEEIKLLAEKNRLLQQTRDLLLPRLISGKLSVAHLSDEEDNLSIAAEPELAYGKK